MFKRKLEPVVLSMLDEFRVVYLTGPRQAGKTTMVKTIADIKSYQYITLDDPNLYQAAENDPVGFMHGFKDKKIIIDEFQYLPALIPLIKGISDGLAAHEKGKFILTGSADIFKSAKVQEALPGHMARLELYPLSLTEKLPTHKNPIDLIIQKEITSSTLRSYQSHELAQFIIDGGFPEVQNKSSRAKSMWYQSYIEARLYKDFKSLYEARGDYLSKLQALIDYLAGLSGNLLKYSNVGNDLGLDDKLIKNYIEILEMMFFLKRVPGYLKNTAKAKAITLSKVQLIDTGLACHILGIKKPEQLMPTKYYGALLENLVYLELLKQSSWADDPIKIYHYRDQRQHEVDFICELSNHQIIGIEVKASATIKKEDFKGLIQLAQNHPKSFFYGMVFYSGEYLLSFSEPGTELYAVPLSFLFNYET
ncbi:MAG: ATP-binding protein [Gammaproteobacteria bacterium]|nr:ATP-binding protein [Gammaproteobacteria bacterium]